MRGGPDRAVVAFPLYHGGDQNERGLILAHQGPHLERALAEGLRDAPRRGWVGLRVWEGRLWFEGDEGAPEPEDKRWRNGLLFDGVWRLLNRQEWQAIQQNRDPLTLRAAHD